LKTAFYIARRYLISKKSVNVINLISGISVAGVTVGTFALVVILSAFNGLDSSIQSLYSSFDPDIKITAAQGKSFDQKDFNVEAIQQIPGIATITPIIEEDAMLSYSNRKYFATIKGVPSNYNEISDLDTSYITSGQFLLEDKQVPLAVVGQGVAYFLSVGLHFSDPIHIFTLRKGTKGRPNLATALNHNTIFAAGVFASQQEIDSKYVLVPFSFAQEIFEMGTRVSSVEIGLEKDAPGDFIKTEIARQLGSQFVVQTQYEQHELFYKVMKSEKWVIFLFLGFVLIIASFNILGSLSMLIIDKKSDIAILQSLGANQKLIRTIFLFEGWMISLAGAVLGIILGVLVCWIQIEFGILKIPGNDGSFIFTSYPVEIRPGDLSAIFFLVTGIGFMAAWYPIRFINEKQLNGPVK